MNNTKPTRIQVHHQQGLRFRAEGSNHRSQVLDGDSVAGFSPMESLLASLCGCMAIDIVMILEKMRLDVGGLTIHAQGWRPADPPRYFQKIELSFLLQGEVPEEKAERAIKLSFDKYCSVFHTLRQDLQVVRHLEITPVTATTE